VCSWENDGQGEDELDVVRGGPNGGLSLRKAPANYAEFGASDERLIEHVRRPNADEMPEAV
jgi:hypothetical protein